MSETTSKRAAQNQALFRDVNEQVKHLNENSSQLTVNEWVCECANTECLEHIELKMAEYERVRAASDTFAIAPSLDHVLPGVEDVTEYHDRYWVVRKLGLASTTATDLDSRTDD